MEIRGEIHKKYLWKTVVKFRLTALQQNLLRFQNTYCSMLKNHNIILLIENILTTCDKHRLDLNNESESGQISRRENFFRCTLIMLGSDWTRCKSRSDGKKKACSKEKFAAWVYIDHDRLIASMLAFSLSNET